MEHLDNDQTNDLILLIVFSMCFRTFQVARPSWNMTWMWGTLLLYVSIRTRLMQRKEVLKSEVAYLLQNDMAKPSNSSESTPCILVPKPDGPAYVQTIVA